MSGVDPRGFPEHRRDSGHDGYTYALNLSTGIVKVGQTRNPRGRLTAHVGEAARFGVTVVDAWVSPRHINYRENERELIRYLGSPEYGGEYFRADFADVVAKAKTLTFRRLSDTERQSLNKSSSDLAKSLFGDDKVVSIVLGPAEELIFARKDVSRWPFQQVLGVDLPPRLATGGDPAELVPLIDQISRMTGIPAEDIWDWSYIDYLRHMCKTIIDTECWNLELRAAAEERTDLLDPIFAPTLANLANLFGSQQ